MMCRRDGETLLIASQHVMRLRIFVASDGLVFYEYLFLRYIPMMAHALLIHGKPTVERHWS